MHEKGVGISSRAAELIQTQLQDKLTQEISSLLEKLTGDDLPVVEEQTKKGGIKLSPQKLVSLHSKNVDYKKRNGRTKRFFVSQNEDSLIRMYEQMKSKGEISKNILKQVFSFYGRSFNLEKLLELKEVSISLQHCEYFYENFHLILFEFSGFGEGKFRIDERHVCLYHRCLRRK